MSTIVAWCAIGATLQLQRGRGESKDVGVHPVGVQLTVVPYEELGAARAARATRAELAAPPHGERGALPAQPRHRDPRHAAAEGRTPLGLPAHRAMADETGPRIYLALSLVLAVHDADDAA